MVEPKPDAGGRDAFLGDLARAISELKDRWSNRRGHGAEMEIDPDDATYVNAYIYDMADQRHLVGRYLKDDVLKW